MAILVVAAASVVGWAFGGIYGWAGVTLVGATAIAYLGFRPDVMVGLFGSRSDDMVGVEIAPNAPFAEMLVEKLQSNGIGAWYRTVAVQLPAIGITPSTNPSGRCEILVRTQDAEQARLLLKEVPEPR